MQLSYTIPELIWSIYGALGDGAREPFAIYPQFGGEILRNLSSRMMRCEGFTAQLRVRCGGTQNVAFEQGGDVIATLRKTIGEKECVGQPTELPQKKRVESNGRTRPTVQKERKREIKKEHPPDDPKVGIDEGVMKEAARGGRFWDIISRPDCACGDDGLDALMAEAALRYINRGNDCVDEAYHSGNFRRAEMRSRDLRMARVASRERSGRPYYIAGISDGVCELYQLPPSKQQGRGGFGSQYGSVGSNFIWSKYDAYDTGATKPGQTYN